MKIIKNKFRDESLQLYDYRSAKNVLRVTSTASFDLNEYQAKVKYKHVNEMESKNF